MSKLDDGAVEIMLDGEMRLLQPTIAAGRVVSRHFGGFQKALTAPHNMDLDACTFIIAAGLGVKRDDKEAMEKVADQVFTTGLLSLSDKVTVFVATLMNGGKTIRADDEGAGSKPNTGES